VYIIIQHWGHGVCVAECVSETVIAPQNAISLELFVAFWHLQHFSKRRRKGIRQNMLSGKFRGHKTAENGGKGRTLKIEFLPETCPKGFTTDFAFFLAVIPLVKLNPSKAAIQVSQCRWKPMLETVL
jgi:hypothetical protein